MSTKLREPIITGNLSCFYMRTLRKVEALTVTGLGDSSIRTIVSSPRRVLSFCLAFLSEVSLSLFLYTPSTCERERERKKKREREREGEKERGVINQVL